MPTTSDILRQMRERRFAALDKAALKRKGVDPKKKIKRKPKPQEDKD